LNKPLVIEKGWHYARKMDVEKTYTKNEPQNKGERNLNHLLLQQLDYTISITAYKPTETKR